MRKAIVLFSRPSFYYLFHRVETEKQPSAAKEINDVFGAETQLAIVSPIDASIHWLLKCT